MASSVHIIATGARTPVGLQAASSAAAVRAEIIGAGTHPFMIDQAGEPMPGALDALLDAEMMGPNRLLALAELPLREVCLPLENASGPRLQLPLYLGLPECRPGFGRADAEVVQNELTQIGGLPVDISEVRAFAEGHAAGLSAMKLATEQIGQGMLEACLVGGVDSYFDPNTMEWLDENRQLVGTISRSAFVPGEGAGFCLMMAPQACRRLRLDALARVRGIGLGRETKLIKTSDVCLGKGLTATVMNALTSLRLPAETISDIICDINGERYRAEEWGFVCLRLPQYFDDPTAYRSPADSWGDIGAASIPLFAMLACQAAAHGYATGPRTLLWASSEGGIRGAAVLELANVRNHSEGCPNHV